MLLHIFFGGLRVAEAVGFVFFLAGITLADEIGANGAATSIGRFHRGLLHVVQGFLDFLELRFFHGAVRRVRHFVGGLDVDRVNMNAGAIGADRDDYVANTDGAHVCALKEVPGSNGVGAHFVIDLAGPLPMIEQGSGSNGLGTSQSGLFIKDQGSVNDVVLLDGDDGLPNFIERAGKLARKTRGS